MATLIETKDGGFIGAAAAHAERYKADGDESNAIVLLVSTESVDSDGDVIHQRKSKNGPGWDLARFNKSPVVTWQHDMRVPNLSGPRTRAKQAKHPEYGQALFLNPLQLDEGDQFAMVLDGKVRRDVITESSVGFKITHHEPRLVDGVRKGLDIYGADLSEVALANRGANPDTEAMAKALLGDPAKLAEVRMDGAQFESMKAELQELAERLSDSEKAFAMLADVVKTFGDQETAHQVIVETKKAQVNDAAAEVLAVLRKAGVARN